jgi:hypothetical protein
MTRPSLTEIRRTLRDAFPDADIKVTKIKRSEDDIDLAVTSSLFYCREALEALVTETYGVEYIGRRCNDGNMLGEVYGPRYGHRHRFDFVTPE